MYKRQIQRSYGRPEQAVLTMPLLVGIDGEQKMSKSLGNHIGITEPPNEIYGRAMSIPDSALEDYYRLLLRRDLPDLPPRDAKRTLAWELVAWLYDSEAADGAQEHFDRVIVAKEQPREIPEVSIEAQGSEVHLPAALASAFGVSRSEARRLIDQGAVSVDGTLLEAGVHDVSATELDGAVIRAGKRRYARLRVLS